MDITEISQHLSSRAEEIARFLLPHGKREGAEWRAGSTDGEKGRSLGVHLSGGKAGVWADFATGTGGGDLIDLWAIVKGVSLSEALKQAKDYLGIQRPVFVGSTGVKEYRKPSKPICKKPVEQSPIMSYLKNERGLSEQTITAYQVAEMTDERGPLLVFPFKRDDELINIKYLWLERDEKGKKITRFEQGCQMVLFGWHVIPDNAREVLICEGELDALSWFDCGVPALSVPNGAKSFTWLENEYENLERFDTIYLSWDMDADGRMGVAEAVDRLGRHRCRVVSLPYKDANECLQNNISPGEMQSYFVKAESCDPAELKRASVFVEEVIDEFYPPSGTPPGFLSPWPKMHDLLRFRRGELTIWTGFSKHGKTTLLNQVILSGMEQGERACIASLEIKPRKLLKRMTKQATGAGLPRVEQIRQAHLWYDGKLWLFDLVGSAKEQRLFEVFDYARRRYGITQFVVDSLVRCGFDEDDYNGQKRFTDHCAEFATSHDVGFHLVAHGRKKDSDRSPSGRLDVRGAAALTDLAHNVYTVWRNRDKEKAVEAATLLGYEPDYETAQKPDALLLCDATREGEWNGQAGLWFDRQSFQYLEASGMVPYIYVRDIVSDIGEDVEAFY